MEDFLFGLLALHDRLKEESTNELRQITVLYTLILSAIAARRYPQLNWWIHDILCAISKDLHQFPQFSNWIALKSLRVLQQLGYLVQGDRYMIDASYLYHILSRQSEFDSRCVYYAFLAFSSCSNLSESHICTASLSNLFSNEMKKQLEVDDVQIDLFIENGTSSIRTTQSVAEFQSIIEEAFRALPSEKAQYLQLSNRLVRLGSCWIPVTSRKEISFPSVILTETTAQNLESIAGAIMLGKPVVVQGESGSGKISLIKEVARIMGYQDRLVTLQLNDQSDGRSLLGAYVCTDVPGEFKWQAGILTQAALNGYWLVIQDIDKVPLDIIALMSSLLEFRTLYLPQRKYPIQAHPHFRIIATRSISALHFESTLDVSHQFSIPHLRNFAFLWFYIDIRPLTSDEIKCIVNARYPSIPQFYLQQILRLVSGFDRSRSLYPDAKSMGSGIQRGNVSLTKALKIARRLNRYSNLYGIFDSVHTSSSSSPELYVTDKLKHFFFQDFIDIFSADNRHEDEFVKSVHSLGQFLGIPPSEVEHVLYHHSIDITKTESTIQMGRCLIQNMSSQQLYAVHGNNLSFAETKYAKRLLEKILVCVEMNEPVLLVGETGTGKTTVVQQLAQIFHQELIVQNLSLSTDSGDLLGGFRPATIRDTLLPIYEDFVRQFQETMSTTKNTDFLTIVSNFFQQRKWQKLLQSFLKGCKSAMGKLESTISKQSANNLDISSTNLLRAKYLEWQTLEESVTKFQYNLPKLENGFAFRVVKGLLVQAFERGQWILLDEINLAPPETIQLLSRFLTTQEEFITIEMNGGDLTTIKRHPNFRIFAAMNPPTDVCKRELPSASKSKFTELYVAEMSDREDLMTMVQSYLSHDHINYCSNVVDVYLGCRSAAEIHLTDGSGQKPRFSLRSLTRALKSALKFYQMGMKPMGRCLFEGFLLSFQTCLSSKSKSSMYAILLSSFYPEGKGKSNDEEAKKLDFPCSKPKSVHKDQQWIQAKPFWIEQGHHQEPIDWASPDAAGVANFVSTKTVLKFIRILSSAVAASVAPILLQGPTSIGKTTVIQYLGAKLGYHCVRINNHEHTDVQEYVGGYVTGIDGKMVFQDGLLVQALRNGYWIILDELNLAPSEVLEALNRLLDDNRELLIPETGEIVKPAKGFQLFATQNPPGIYGGRKPLSLAFRNRFIEIDLDDIPPKEMEQIITTRCGIAPKFATMMVKICEELQIQRQQSNFLLGKEGSITMRDLLKWGNRSPQNPLEVAQFGFMLLCEKLRTTDEKNLVRKLLAKVCKLPTTIAGGQIDNLQFEDALYGNFESLLAVKQIIQQSRTDNNTAIAEGIEDVAITHSFNRMWQLLSAALDHSEPVLLVGETGAGKTMACQLYAALNHRPIRILNCHQTTETADIIGSLRPVRGRQLLLSSATDQLNELMKECLLSGALSYSSIEAEISATGNTNRRKRRDNEAVENTEESLDGIEEIESMRSSLEMMWTSQLSTGSSSLNHQLWLDQLKKLLELVQSNLSNNSSLEDSKSGSEHFSNLKSDPESSKESHKNKKRKVSKSIENSVAPVSNAESPFRVLLNDWSKTVASIQKLLQKSEALFEWVDGPLVECMREGAIFVLDEINLAEDAVIERLNSVLEANGELTLAEKGGEEDDEAGGSIEPHRVKSSITIKPHPSFRIIATMNPSGDFGKRELSPALRSRLTEVWIPNSLSFDERALLVSTYLHLPGGTTEGLKAVPLKVAQLIVKFTSWIQEKLNREFNINLVVSNREIISWTKFVNAMMSKLSVTQPSDALVKESIYTNVIHGAYLTMLDGLSMLQGMSTDIVNNLRLDSLEVLLAECGAIDGDDAVFTDRIRRMVRSLITVDKHFPIEVEFSTTLFTVGYFSTPLRPSLMEMPLEIRNNFVFETPKVTLNVGRILRAMQIGRPILLEGPPGVGKTSLITNLAKRTGHHLVRINLSEQTELSDLLGSDLPAVPSASDEEGRETNKHQSKFKWYDGIFLTAMKEGHWVLLDELNLAPQTVLEGLNACFDHRGQVFLPEIGQTVHCSPYFRIFAAQNPLREGGGRKGLPASFLSRFTKVVFDSFSEEDLVSIMSHTHNSESAVSTGNMSESNATASLDFSTEMIEKMVRVTHRLNEAATSGENSFGHEGSPWEFNLRDVMRWCDTASSLARNRCSQQKLNYASISNSDIVHSAFYLFGMRLRNAADRIFFRNIVFDIFGKVNVADVDTYIPTAITSSTEEFSHSNVFRAFQMSSSSQQISPRFEDGQLSYALLRLCVQHQLPVLVVGPQGSNRKAAILSMAKEQGRTLRYFAAFPSLDSTEMLGSYGQTTWEALVQEVVLSFEDLITRFMAVKVFANDNSRSIVSLDMEKHIMSISKELTEIHNVINASFGSSSVAEHPMIVSQLKAMYDHFTELVVTIPSLDSSGFYSTRLSHTRSKLQELESRETNEHSVSSGASFQWEDGAVVSAIQAGEWLLFDHVNLAPASVLDRLNSLLEPHGTLLLTEDGSGRHISPHPDFRIFFVMDPMFGEISRAMRNRCVEMFHSFPSTSLSYLPPSAGTSLIGEHSILRSHQIQVWLRSNVLSKFPVEEYSSQGQHLINMLHSAASFLQGNDSVTGLQLAVEKLLHIKVPQDVEIHRDTSIVAAEHSRLPLVARAILLVLHCKNEQEQLKSLVEDHLQSLPLFAGTYAYENLAIDTSLRTLQTETLQVLSKPEERSEEVKEREGYLLFQLAICSSSNYGSGTDHITSLFLSEEQQQQFVVFQHLIRQLHLSYHNLETSSDESMSGNHLLWLRVSTSFDEWKATHTAPNSNLSSFMAGEASLTLLQLAALMTMKLLAPSSLALLLIREIDTLLQQVSGYLDRCIQHSATVASKSKWTEVLRARSLLVRLLLSFRLSASGVVFTQDQEQESSFPAAALVVILQNLESSLTKLNSEDLSSWFKSIWKYLYQLWDGFDDQTHSCFQKLNNSLIELERPHSIPITLFDYQIVCHSGDIYRQLRTIELLNFSDNSSKNCTMIVPFRVKEQKRIRQEILHLLSTYRMLTMKDAMSSLSHSQQEAKVMERSSMIVKILQSLKSRVSSVRNSEQKRTPLQPRNVLSLEDIRQEIAIKEFSERETYLLCNDVIRDSQLLERKAHVFSPLASHIGRNLIEKCDSICLSLSFICHCPSNVLPMEQLPAICSNLSQLISGIMSLVNIETTTLASVQLTIWLLECIVQNDAGFSAESAHSLYQSISTSVINELNVLRRDLASFVEYYDGELVSFSTEGFRSFIDFSILEQFVLEQVAIAKRPRAEAMYDAIVRNASRIGDYSNLPAIALRRAQLSSRMMSNALKDFESMVILGKGAMLRDQSSLRKKMALDYFGQVSSISTKSDFMTTVVKPEVVQLVFRLLVIIKAILPSLPVDVQHRLATILSLDLNDSSMIIDALVELFTNLSTSIADYAQSDALTIGVSMLLPAVETLRQSLSVSMDEREVLQALGSAMWQIHHIRFLLCVPASPLDPSHLQSWRVRLFAHEARRSSDFYANGLMIRALAGYSLVDHLLVAIGQDSLHLSNEVESIRERVFIRKRLSSGTEVTLNADDDEEKSAYEELYTVLRSSRVSGVFHEESMQNLIESLSKGTESSSSELESRARTWMSNAESIVAVLRSKFSPTYDDYVIPLVSTVDGMIQGVQILFAVYVLRCKGHFTAANIVESSSEQELTITKQLQHQCVKSALLVTSVSKRNNRYNMYVQLEQLSILWSQGLITSDILESKVRPLYLQFVRMYLEEEIQRKKDSLTKSSLYQSKTTEEDDTDEKRAERAFRQQFPDHLDDLQKYLQPSSEEQDESDIEGDESDAAEELQCSTGGKFMDDMLMILRIVSSHMQYNFCLSSEHNSNHQQHESKILVNEYRNLHVLKQQDQPSSSNGTFFQEVQNQDHHALELVSGIYWNLGFHNDFHHRVGDDDDEIDLTEEDILQYNSGNVTGPKKVSFASKWKGKGSKSAHEGHERPIDRDLAYLLNPFPHEDSDAKQFVHNDNLSAHCPLNIEDIGAFSQEIAAALPPVNAVIRAVRKLLQQFPGNEIILKILRLCLQISSTSVTQISLSKMLVQYQVLLQVMQEWEQVAARHVSLSAEMKGVTNMIIRWRRLEYASWMSLLRKTEILQSQEATKHWFSLMKIFQVDLPQLLHPYRKVKLHELKLDWQRLCWWEQCLCSTSTAQIASQSISDLLPEDIRTFLSTLLKTLDTFLRASTVGEFPTRLHLLRSISLMLNKEDRKLTSSSSLRNASVTQFVHRHITQLLLGIWQYFAQFLPIVRRFQDLLRQPLAERVKNEVKFGKWDDLNAYALLENSEKVHRKLHKIAQEYDKEVLSTSVQMLIDREATKHLVNEAGELVPAVEIPVDSQLYPLATTGKDEEEPKLDDYLEQFIDKSLLFNSIAGNKKGEKAELRSIMSSTGEIKELPVTIQKVPTYLKKMKHYFLELFDVTHFLADSDDDESKAEQQSSDSVAHGMPVTSISYALQAADLCESMAQEIFDRVAALRGSDVMKNMKWKAVRDLFETLQEHGFTGLQSMLPPEVRDNASVLSHTAFVPIVLAQDLQYLSGSSDVTRNFLEKAEYYHQRNLLELWQLRVQSVSAHSADVGHRDVLTMLHLSESMLVHALHLRHTTSEVLTGYVQFQQSKDKFSAILQKLEAVTTGTTVTTVGMNDLLRRYDEVNIRVRLLARRFVRLGMMLRMLHDGSELYDQCSGVKKIRAGVSVPSSPEDDDTQLGYDLPPREILLSFSAEDIATNLETVKSIVDLLYSAMETNGYYNPANHKESALFSMRQSNSLSLAIAKYGENTSYTDDVTKWLPVMLAKVEAVNKLLEQNGAQVKLLISTLAGKSRFDEISGTIAAILQPSHSVSASSNPINDDELCQLVTSCIDTARLSVQKLLAHTPQQQQQRISSGNDAVIEDTTEITDVKTVSARPSSLSSYLRDAIATIQSTIVAPSALASSLHRLNNFLWQRPVSDLHPYVPVLKAVLEVLRIHGAAQEALIDQHILAYKSYSKLSYIVLRVFRNLVAKGICSQEANDDGDGSGQQGGNPGDMRFEDDIEGTGMGEGDGKKDVSNEIENEEQLLGTKDQSLKDLENADKPEEKKKEQLNKDEKDTGVEMTQDFEGDMFDLPSEDEEEEKENRRNEEEDKSDGEEELDREMGDADEDDIVDERQWDSDDEDDKDKNKEDKKDQKEKFENDSKMKGEAIEDEMHTKDTNENDDDSVEEAGDENEKDNAEKAPKKLPTDDDSQEDRINEEEEAMERPRGVKPQEQAHPDEMDEDEEKEEDGAGDKGNDDEDEELEGDETAMPMEADGDEDAEGGKDKEGDSDLPDDMQLDGNDEDADEDEGDQQDPADDAAGILGEEIESVKDEDERMDEDDEEQDNLNGGDGSNIPEQEEPPSNPLEQEKKPDLQKKKSKKQNKQPLTHGIHDEAGDDRILNQPLAEDEQVEQDEEKKEAGAGGDEQEAEEEEEQAEREDNSSAPSQPQQKDRNQKSSSSSASGGDDKSKDNKNQSQSQDQSSSVQKKQKQQHQPHEKNPFLQMGDIEKDWHRRLNLVDESDDERDGNLHQEDQDDGEEPEQKGKQDAYEFAKQEDSSKNLSQVLAGSDKDTAKQLPQSGEIPDMNEDDRNKHGDAQEDADQEESPRNLFDDNDERLPKESSKPTYRESTPKEPDANEDQVNEERKRDRDESSSAPSQPQRKKRRTVDDQATNMDVDGAESSPEHSEDEEDEDERVSKPLEKKADTREEGKSPAEPLALTQKPMHTSQQFVFGAKSSHADGDWDSDSLQQIATTGASAALSSLAPAAATLARQRWQNYRTQTEAHALRLSETLRLILAPTLATRLQGDYRTGKRINMRKVIPYIASGYRKDKIWLRRTKPAKRAYQIMLMIDDSRSMGQSTAGQLAMSSLALLSTALVRLEVGELCIASFAKELNVIHPFGRPFTEDVGTQIAAHFQFEAEETNVSQSLESTLPVFQTAKESLLTSSASASSDTAVLQICFLMSDARVDSDNRQRLEHIIRTMSEQHILVVLVIIDCNQDARDSIFQTKSIKFTADQQIITSHYFDDFPFPYYVAIQEVGKLPDVLADALKQWFELIKLQLNNQASGA